MTPYKLNLKHVFLSLNFLFFVVSEFFLDIFRYIKSRKMFCKNYVFVWRILMR